MRRRYDLTRSDNIPLVSQVSLPYQEKTPMFVYTGFPVAWVSVLEVVPGDIPFTTSTKDVKKGFNIKFYGAYPGTEFITIRYQAG
jgi:hypothetical protein